MATFQDLPSTTDDVLLDNLSAADIFRFGRTSKTAHRSLQSYANRRFKLSHALSRFFSEDQTEELRTLMSSTGMVISGSVALQFLDRTLYPGSDLDLYSPVKYARQITDWLVSAGYTYAPKKGSLPTVEIALREAIAHHAINHTGNTPSTNRGYLNATCVLDFTARDPPRKVQLMATIRSTIELILGFHSTCVMNIVTHDKAYCLFPQATFEERRALTYLNLLSTREAHEVAYHKYTERGWDLVESITRDEFDNPYSSFARGTRFVGDSKCWTLPILPLREDLLESNVDINSFALEYDENLKSVFSFRHLDLAGLQQPYVLLQEDADYVMEKLAFGRNIQFIEDHTEGADIYGYIDEEEQSEGNTDDEDENDDGENPTGNIDNGAEVTNDHTLRLLMVEIRELDINRM